MNIEDDIQFELTDSSLYFRLNNEDLYVYKPNVSLDTWGDLVSLNEKAKALFERLRG